VAELSHTQAEEFLSNLNRATTEGDDFQRQVKLFQ
jgi:hypothetical protein